MACDFGLLARRHYRLVVFVSLRPVIGRVFAALARFDVEIMGLLSPLIDEILAQAKIGLISGGAVELYQRQLNFLMPTVPMFLVRVRPKDRANMVSIAAQDVQ